MKWALLWALLIFILCSIPGHDIPHISFLELLSFDKFVHAGMFFVLFSLLSRGFRTLESYPTLTNKARGLALVLCVTYGGMLELMQGAFFVERTADWFDFLANSAGAILALLFYKGLEKHLLYRLIP